jgi:hypothetical protein
MGRKAGVMRVNPKTLTRKTFPCFQEMLVFLSCVHKFNYDDDKCMNEKKALNMCMELQVLFLYNLLFLFPSHIAKFPRCLELLAE